MGRERNVAPIVMPYRSVIRFAVARSMFSSIEIESGAVLHIASMFLVASPQTKNEDNAPRSRMKAKRSR